MDFYKDGAPHGDEEEIKEAKLGMGPEERRQIFNAGLEIPGDTEAIEPADDSMDFYTGDHKHSKKKDDSELGMSAELRRQYFIAGLEIPEDTEAIREPDGTMDFYKDGAPQGDSEKDDSELGMGPEER